MNKSFDVHFRLAQAADQIKKSNPSLTFEQSIARAVDDDNSLYTEIQKLDAAEDEDDIGKLLIEAYERSEEGCWFDAKRKATDARRCR